MASVNQAHRRQSPPVSSAERCPCPAGTAGRARKTEQTRRRILAAALRRFATAGYAGTTTRSIIEAAKITKPVLYYHFGSKEGLFQAVVDYNEDRLLRLVSQTRRAGGDVAEQLANVCAALFRSAGDQPGGLELAADLLFQARQPRPSHDYCFSRAQKRLTVVETIMEQGKRDGWLSRRYAARQLALNFLGMIHLNIVLHLAERRSRLTLTTARQVVSLFLNGAAAGESKPFPHAN